MRYTEFRKHFCNTILPNNFQTESLETNTKGTVSKGFRSKLIFFERYGLSFLRAMIVSILFETSAMVSTYSSSYATPIHCQLVIVSTTKLIEIPTDLGNIRVQKHTIRTAKSREYYQASLRRLQ